MKREVKLSIDQVLEACSEYVVNHKLIPDGNWALSAAQFEVVTTVLGIRGYSMEVKGVQIICEAIEKPQPPPPEKPPEPDPTNMN